VGETRGLQVPSLWTVRARRPEGECAGRLLQPVHP